MRSQVASGSCSPRIGAAPWCTTRARPAQGFPYPLCLAHLLAASSCHPPSGGTRPAAERLDVDRHEQRRIVGAVRRQRSARADSPPHRISTRNDMQYPLCLQMEAARRRCAGRWGPWWTTFGVQQPVVGDRYPCRWPPPCPATTEAKSKTRADVGRGHSPGGGVRVEKRPVPRYGATMPPLAEPLPNTMPMHPRSAACTEYAHATRVAAMMGRDQPDVVPWPWRWRYPSPAAPRAGQGLPPSTRAVVADSRSMVMGAVGFTGPSGCSQRTSLPAAHR